MSSEQFYAQLTVHNDFSAVSELSNYVPLPDDWHVVAADVQDSTGAIRAGHYKAVNVAGVSVITSIRNIAKPMDLPYMFGGDGATLCIPPDLLTRTRQALIATRIMAATQFQLYLRVGVVPVRMIREAGFDVLLMRHRLSKYYIQAAFAGGGLEYAEDLIKDEQNGKAFRLEGDEEKGDADYSGLECRWNNVPSEHGEIIALMVKALASSIEREAAIYNEIIEKIRAIYGNDDICRPVYTKGLQLTDNSQKLSYEVKLKTFGKEKAAIIKYWLLLRVQMLIGRICMSLGLKTGDIQWANYKTDTISNTDFRKFDGILRQVLSGTAEQRMELDRYLQGRFTQGDCVYGIHVSDSALITCMINNREGDHFHFVDGADGGYAMAATAMKAQLAKKDKID